MKGAGNMDKLKRSKLMRNRIGRRRASPFAVVDTKPDDLFRIIFPKDGDVYISSGGSIKPEKLSIRALSSLQDGTKIRVDGKNMSPVQFSSVIKMIKDAEEQSVMYSKPNENRLTENGVIS